MEILLFLSPSVLHCSFPKVINTKREEGRKHSGGVPLWDKPWCSTQVWWREDKALLLIQPIPLIQMPTCEQAVSPVTALTPYSPAFSQEMWDGEDARMLPEKQWQLGKTTLTGRQKGLHSTVGKQNPVSTYIPCSPAVCRNRSFHKPRLCCTASIAPPAPPAPLVMEASHWPRGPWTLTMSHCPPRKATLKSTPIFHELSKTA